MAVADEGGDVGSAKLIFITGGVVSSLGKGVASASLAALLQSRGYKVGMRKLDPYLNVDPGTMSPFQHGEVFVTDDGAETDLDLGHYERFTGINTKHSDNVTTGQIYSMLLKRERKGEYLGGTVQVIPHVTDLIKEFIKLDLHGLDFMLCEIGGTVGDIEGLPYFEAIRQIGYELGRENVVYIHLTLVPYLSAAQELKTKPTQHSVKELCSIGIQPNIIVCRADREIPMREVEKIALFSNISPKYVIQAIDCDNIYQIPITYHQFGFDDAVLRSCGMLETAKQPDLSGWYDIVDRFTNCVQKVTVGLVGKYNQLKDAYKSLLQALEHAGIAHKCRVEVKWIDTETLEKDCGTDNDGVGYNSLDDIFSEVDGIIVPGGFGNRGVDGKIAAIRYAREHNVPFLGICLGMQLALIEYARNVLGMKRANSTEFCTDVKHCVPIIGLLEEWHGDDIGGTMRLGAQECALLPGSTVCKLYNNATEIVERHRHRYEFNMRYYNVFAGSGMIFSGFSVDKKLIEVVELPYLDFFIATQFHPEFKSRPATAHPLFAGFVKVMMNRKDADAVCVRVGG